MCVRDVKFLCLIFSTVDVVHQLLFVNLFDWVHTFQCVCDWDDRKKLFIEVEGIIQRQIKVLINTLSHFNVLVLVIIL